MVRREAQMNTSDPGTAPLAPEERRQRNRQEMVEAIVAAARAILLERGVGALNLNEVARRVRMRPQSLAGYFPSKAALYDELIYRAFALMREGDEAAYRDHPAGWDQIEAWFANRISIATANPDSYHLAFDAPVPDYVPDDRAVALSREILASSRRMVADAMSAGIIHPGIGVEPATDVLLALRRGLVAERIGKQRYLAADSARFDELLPVVLHMIEAAWARAPGGATPRFAAAETEGGADGSP